MKKITDYTDSVSAIFGISKRDFVAATIRSNNTTPLRVARSINGALVGNRHARRKHHIRLYTYSGQVLSYGCHQIRRHEYGPDL
jgi:hypothetical protein